MTVRLDSLRVGAEFDASKYQTGAQQMTAADRAMISSKQALGAAFTQADAKVSQSGDSLARLNRTYVEGYRNQERFEQGLRQISRQLDSGKTDIDGATRLLVGMGQKLGVTADASALFAQGQVQLATAVGIANTQLEAQVSLIERARAEQAAANAQQIAAANQNKVNTVLGVAVPTTGSASASASVFEAEFARLQTIAEQRAAQIGQNFGADLSFSLVAGTRKSARDAATVFEAELDRIDQIAALKAQQAGSYFQQDLNTRFGIGVSGKSARGSAEVFENAPRPGGPRLSSYQMQGLGYQANDIATMALLGASPTQIAFSQGGQVLQTLQMGEGGIAGSLSAIKGGAVAAGTALAGVLGTTGLIATGFGAVALAAGAFYLATRDKAKDLNAVLSQQKDIVSSLGPAFEEMASQQKGPYENVGVGRLTLEKNLQDAQKAAGEQARKAISEAQGSGGTFLNLFRMLPQGAQSALGYRPEAQEFDRIIEGASKSEMSINDARTALQRFGEDHPDFAYVIGRFMEMTEAAAQSERQVGKLAGIVDRFAKIRLPEKGILPKGAAGDELDAATIAARNRADRQFAADQLSLNAKSPQELAAAARAQAGATVNSDETAAMRSNRIDLAGKKALIEAEHQLKEAEDQRQRSILQTVAAAKLDADSVGKTTAAVEAAKFESQQLAQIREEAARNGITSEAEIQKYYGKSIELIRQQAAEYGKLIALQEARSTIKQQEQDLELGKTELTTLNDNTLARNRAIEAARTEQQIKRLGIPLYGAEAEAMRKNTAELSAQADAMAHATLQRDLMFERQQILMNSDDAAIASRLQSAGLPVDLNSMEAQMMRYNLALSETKDTFKGFFTDMFSGLREGKSLWESFKDAAVNALGKIADKLIDRGLDGIFNSIFGDGQTSGGGLLSQLLGNSGSQSPSSANGGSSLLGKLFGGGGATQSVATMQVQAATVIVNGGIGGGGIPGLDAINSFLGGSSFKPNTTLSDILGYGGAANDNTSQNYIQTRIDQAFGTTATQGYIQSRIDQAFGTVSPGLGGIFSPSGGYASVLGGGSLTGSIGQYASAIRAVESLGSGGYSALGPVLKSGDQALGAYQIMASNLPSWSQSALGRSVSRSEFMGSPDIQDAIFEHQFGSYLNKYGNPQDAASAWFTGGPLSSGAGKMDVLGTTGSKYVDKFNSALEKLGGTTQSATGALNSLGGASQGLISKFTEMGQSLLSSLTPATSGSGWFQGLSGLFGGSAGALGFMNSISPAATSDILSGSWGLFDRGGWTGAGAKDQPAGIVHAGEIVWSQDDIRRAGGAGVVEGMRLGYRGYARGGTVLDRNRFAFGSRHSDSIGASAFNGSRHNGAANDRPTTVNQTNNFIFRENPATPASQNQIAAKTARSVEKVSRTA
ncbi:hypothetical protein EN742_03015 [Mesorhizobium sp. M4A.F.Ca.ET.020.02.1.1]|uniref:phage tail length tape measure family protein n=1 Tax=Mesorhizobium sp. M4A.F.Ca.ET.020.02.1.1 TaxID=2496652 RepID=UPI000FD35616|nr:phage tail length tape measure family protein [Mesorhizobium sp. M4A.F.Ca.ET.020.02.1.1]RVD44216.1 hypothetical protein EN742_03015 [Mesorhizobium sp. M4A.F.Ca.ET.020.02.1.1]